MLFKKFLIILSTLTAALALTPAFAYEIYGHQYTKVYQNNGQILYPDHIVVQKNKHVMCHKKHVCKKAKKAHKKCMHKLHKDKVQMEQNKHAKDMLD